MRTISDPARASAATCFAVPSASAVSVLVIDCTTTGAPPPTVTLPTLTATLRCRSAVPENSIMGNLLVFSLAHKGRAANTDIALSRPVYEDQAGGDQHRRQGKGRGQRLVQNKVAGGDAKQGGK